MLSIIEIDHCGTVKTKKKMALQAEKKNAENNCMGVKVREISISNITLFLCLHLLTGNSC